MNQKGRIRKGLIGICLCGFFISIGKIISIYYGQWNDSQMLGRQQTQLKEQKVMTENGRSGNDGFLAMKVQKAISDMSAEVRTGANAALEILPEYRFMHQQNRDFVGWLSIDGTVIDYPVMQKQEDENYYLHHDFYGNENNNGCLILDTDSRVGNGTKTGGYFEDIGPSANLIIHGHTMRSGEMFGDLDLYAEESYGKEHNVICFDSLYERRNYELIAVFYSQVYRVKDEVFKYYKFFEADTQEEFDNWYKNIKELSLYNTGVGAEFGDEFITLSCCAYHVENGRFVVVGRRIEQRE